MKFKIINTEIIKKKDYSYINEYNNVFYVNNIKIKKTLETKYPKLIFEKYINTKNEKKQDHCERSKKYQHKKYNKQNYYINLRISEIKKQFNLSGTRYEILDMVLDEWIEMKKTIKLLPLNIETKNEEIEKIEEIIY
jgi:hypothetical protein